MNSSKILVLGALLLLNISCGKKSSNSDTSSIGGSGGAGGGGGDGSSDANVVVTQAFGRLFATVATTDADLNSSVTTGDNFTSDPICATEAGLRGLTGVFKVVAALSDRTKNLHWILKNSTEYRRPDGTVIGTTNSSGTFDYPLTSAISATPVRVWSGFDTSFNTDFFSHCSNLNTNGVGNATYGDLQYTDARAFSSSVSGNTTGCSSFNNVLCVEILKRTTTVPAQAAYRRIFPTLAALPAYDGLVSADSIARFDSQCRADASTKGVSNSGYTDYKALVVANNSSGPATRRVPCLTNQCGNGPGEAIGWILEPSTQYRREDGTTIIGTTNLNSIFDFPLTNSFTGVAEEYWSGQNAGWATATDMVGFNCTMWGTAANDGTTANVGKGDAVTSDSISFGPAFCNLTRKILCVEQKRTQTVWVDYPGYN